MGTIRQIQSTSRLSWVAWTQRCLGLIFLAWLAACSSTPDVPVETAEAPRGTVGHYKLGSPYQVAGRWYTPRFESVYRRDGIASWYGEPFHGRLTANGEIFDRHAVSAAHPTLPLPSLVKVTNLENGRWLELRVNDRGPFVDDRLIDLSQAAARALGFEDRGLARVRVEFIKLEDATGTPPQPEPARAEPPQPAPVTQTAVIAPVPQLVACSSGTRVVQVAAFSKITSAHSLARELEPLGRTHIALADVDGQRVARVQLGPFADGHDVGGLLQVLRDRGHTTAFVTTADARLDGCSRV